MESIERILALKGWAGIEQIGISIDKGSDPNIIIVVVVFDARRITQRPKGESRAAERLKGGTNGILVLLYIFQHVERCPALIVYFYLIIQRVCMHQHNHA